MTNRAWLEQLSDKKLAEAIGSSICDMVEQCPGNALTCEICKLKWLREQRNISKEGE